VPIVITPPVNDLVGPGSFLSVSSDVLGPFPTDTRFVFDIGTSNEGVNPYIHSEIVVSQGNGSYQLLDRHVTSTVESTLQPKSGDQVYAVVQFIEGGTNAVLDSGTVQLTWTTTDAIGQQIYTQTTTGGGGLTTEEHGWLDALQQGFANTVQYGGAAATQAFANGIFEHPNPALLQLRDATMSLTGQGNLQRPAAGVGVEAYGLHLEVAVAPDGAGRRNGILLEYVERVAQLATTHSTTAGTFESVTEVLDLHLEQYSWLWKYSFPERILYDVTPGWTLNATWLVWIISP